MRSAGRAGEERKPQRVAYVVKRYPRHSETFIVNELLAHQAAGLEVEIFSVQSPNDTHFQDAISRVQSPVHYLPLLRGARGLDASTPTPESDEYWRALKEARLRLPNFEAGFEAAQTAERAETVYSALALAHALAEHRLEHVHAHFASKATSVARLASIFAGVPYTFTAHAKDIFHESIDPESLAQKIQDAAAVITVSDYNARYLSERCPEAADKLHRIYNGLELDRFPFELPLERPPSVVAVGRLIEKKGFSDLVEACALLAGRGKRVRCRIVGGGPLAQALRGQIEALGLAETVELLGPRPQREIAALVRDAAVFAAPCVVGRDGNRDGVPTVLLEAMALGTPCVSTDVTGIPEVLRHGETGLRVPQHAPEALARAIESLLDTPNLRARLAMRARGRVEAKFDIHRNSAELRALFAAARAPAQAVVSVAS